MSQYNDIINLPHHTSKTRPRMPLADRAAQFSPFAALTGYDAAVQETARQTEGRRELSEDAARELNETLRRLRESADPPPVRITYFLPDERKAGGAYCVKEGTVTRFQAAARSLLLDDGTVIPIDAIFKLVPI